MIIDEQTIASQRGVTFYSFASKGLDTTGTCNWCCNKLMEHYRRSNMLPLFCEVL